MMSQSVKIVMPDGEKAARLSEAKTVGQLRAFFSEEEIVELVLRQVDAARFAKSYRQRRAERLKLTEAALEQVAAGSGMTLKEYLASHQGPNGDVS